MPVIKSAKKRVKVAAKARARNLRTKRQMREALKAYAAALHSRKPGEVTKAQALAMSTIDTAVKKAIIHKNKAARYKSRMAKQAKAAGVKPQATRSTSSAPARPKPKTKAKTATPTAKKTPAKKK